MRISLAALALFLTVPLAAQDVPPPRKPADSTTAAVAAPVDSLSRPSATAALVKSLVLPGLGQLGLGRELTAAVFVAFEAGAVAMVVKSQRDLDRAESAEIPDSLLIDQQKRRREDWLVVLGINHVASAIEAFVSANLWDFPADLKIRAGPDGGMRFSATIPVRLP